MSIKDVTEIVTLLLLILKLIAKLHKCIRYFRRGSWQQDGGDGTINNKIGIESDNSIVASVKASTYICRKWCSSCIQYSFLLLLRIPCYFCFFFSKTSFNKVAWVFFWERDKFFLGPLYNPSNCSTMGPIMGFRSWSSQLALSCALFFLNRVHLGCLFYGFVLSHSFQSKKNWKEKKIEMWDWWIYILFCKFLKKKKITSCFVMFLVVKFGNLQKFVT